MSTPVSFFEGTKASLIHVSPRTARWKSGKCSSSPPCALWSEEKLLAGQSQMVPVAPVVNAVPVVPRPSVQVAAEPDAHPQPCRVRVDESDEGVHGVSNQNPGWIVAHLSVV